MLTSDGGLASNVAACAPLIFPSSLLCWSSGGWPGKGWAETGGGAAEGRRGDEGPFIRGCPAAFSAVPLTPPGLAWLIPPPLISPAPPPLRSEGCHEGGGRIGGVDLDGWKEGGMLGPLLLLSRARVVHLIRHLPHRTPATSHFFPLARSLSPPSSRLTSAASPEDGVPAVRALNRKPRGVAGGGGQSIACGKGHPQAPSDCWRGAWR